MKLLELLIGGNNKLDLFINYKINYTF